MKRLIVSLLVLTFIFSLIGCSQEGVENEVTKLQTACVHSGNYYAIGDYEEFMTPYLWLDTSENRFGFSGGSIISYAEHGTYEIADSKLIATTQSTTFEFEIKDENTLVLTDNGNSDYFKIPNNTQFVFSNDLM